MVINNKSHLLESFPYTFVSKHNFETIKCFEYVGYKTALTNFSAESVVFMMDQNKDVGDLLIKRSFLKKVIIFD
jgi:hypothetical protein